MEDIVVCYRNSFTGILEWEKTPMFCYGKPNRIKIKSKVQHFKESVNISFASVVWLDMCAPLKLHLKSLSHDGETQNHCDKKIK